MLLFKAALDGGDHAQEYLLQARQKLAELLESGVAIEQLNVELFNSIHAIAEGHESTLHLRG